MWRLLSLRVRQLQVMPASPARDSERRPSRILLFPFHDASPAYFGRCNTSGLRSRDTDNLSAAAFPEPLRHLHGKPRSDQADRRSSAVARDRLLLHRWLRIRRVVRRVMTPWGLSGFPASTKGISASVEIKSDSGLRHRSNSSYRMNQCGGQSRERSTSAFDCGQCHRNAETGPC